MFHEVNLPKLFLNIFELWESVLSAPLFYNLHIFSAPFNPSFLVSFELKVFVLGFWEINYLYIFKRKNLSVRYHLGILKCGVSLEGLFKSGHYKKKGFP